MADRPNMVNVLLPADPAVLRGVASVLERSGSWASLASLLEAWQRLESDNPQLLARVYSAWHRAGDQKRADACLHEAAQATAGDRAAALRLYRLLQHRGLEHAAECFLAEAAAQSPSDWQLAMQYALGLEKRNDRDAAVRVLLAAYFHPASTEAVRTVMMRRLTAADRPELMLAMLQAAYRSQPGDWRLALDLAAEMGPGAERDAMLAAAFTHSAQSSAVRAAILRRLLAQGRREEAGSALAALFSNGNADAPRVSNARRAAIEQLLEAGEGDLVDSALASYARNAPTALATYLSSQHALPFHEPLIASLGRIRHRGVDTLRFELALLRSIESGGRYDDADRLQQALASRMVIEAKPSEASPTPSTMMFRNLPLLDALVVTIGWYAKRRSRVRVHVAACSSGEEAYSLALALHQANLLDQCELSASDVDPDLVRRARTGVVDKGAMELVPEAMLGLFERRGDGRFQLAPAIHSRIAFSVQDLLGTGMNAERYDVFIANNVLVHFPHDDRKRMLGHIVGKVAIDGLVCLGGSRQDDLEESLGALGVVPIETGSAEIFDAWRIQRNGWYQSPRPYWALPPARLTAACPWKHATLFARDAETAAALEKQVSAGVAARLEAGETGS